MPDIATSSITTQLLAVLHEAIEGPAPGGGSYFTDNKPDAGLLGTIAPLTAPQASRALGPSGTSIAGHLHHLAFCLDASAAWIGEGKTDFDWNDSWRVKSVTDAEWGALKSRLKQAYTELGRVIEKRALASDDTFGGAVGAIAHAAYHLAVIRQKAGEVGR